MCLGVPGQVVEVLHNEIGIPMGKVGAIADDVIGGRLIRPDSPTAPLS